MADYLPFSADILDVRKFILKLDPGITHKRIINDYEFDFYVGGNRKITINNESYNIGNGSVVFRKPGDIVISSGSYNCYCLTLDFSHKKKDLCGIYDRNNNDNSRQETSNNPLLDLIPTHFISRHPGECIEILDKLCYNYQSVDSKINDMLINQLFSLALTDTFYYNSVHNENNDFNNNFLITTCKYIQENSSKPITINELAANVSLSPSYFLKMFKKATNTTPAEYIISIRFSKAKQLLAESNLTMANIATLCGFNDASYFSYYFKKGFGITPSVYRENQNT